MIRVFVGCPANNEDLECQAVLEYSIRKQTDEEVDITWMMLSRDPASFWYSDPVTREGWNTRTWATPFSALRWGVPAACGYEGRGIYMDSDQIVLADLGELWGQSFPPGKAILAKGLPSDMISCVMLFDCMAMRGKLPPIGDLKSIPGLYREVRRSVKSLAANYSGDWNCRDGENHKSIRDPDVKILHYTHIPTQPNHKHARARLAAEGKKHWYPGPDVPHPRREVQEIFDQYLVEAIAAGYGPERYRVSPEFGEYGR